MVNEKVIGVLKHIVGAVLSLGLMLAAFAIGLFTANGGAWEIACFVFGGALAALGVVNIVLYLVWKKKWDGMPMREGHDYAEKMKSEIEKNYAAAENKVRMTIIVSYAYAAFLLVLAFLFCFSLGRLGPDAGFVTFLVQFLFVAGAAAFMWGIVYMFFAVEPPVPLEMNVVLDESEYPQFYAVAKRAAAAAGCGDRKVVLYDMTDGISVTCCGDTVYINLDYAETAVLTREELFNVMLHEFAHVVYDFKRGRLFRRAMSRSSCEDRTSNPFVKLSMLCFFMYASAKMQFAILVFDTVSSRNFEQRADDMTIRAGNKQVYADACAKIDGYFQYIEMNCREISYDFYAPEKPEKGFASRVVELYYKYREKYASEWKKQILCELPANVDSHPTTRMRLDALGVTDFVADRKETDEGYLAEVKKFLESRDEIVYKRMVEEEGYYDNFRKNAYLSRKAVMDAYIAEEANGEPTEPHMLHAARAFIGIDDDKALEIIDRALSIDSAAPRANFMKGLILFNRRDRACVDCFKRASALPRLVEDAYDFIGRFALKTGDEKLLKEYRDEVCDVTQNAVDTMEQSAVRADTELLPHGLDADTVNALVKDLTEKCEGISEIYVCKYADESGAEHYPVVVSADSNQLKSYDEYCKFMSAVCHFLDFYSDRRDFFCFYGSSSGRLGDVAKVENAKVYEKKNA